MQRSAAVRDRHKQEDDRASVADTLRSAGLRVSPQRCAVRAVFRTGAAPHLTADDVYKRARQELPELARATVYNSLGDLVGAGLLQVIEGFGSAKYELHSPDEHHHFHCRVCGSIRDVHVEGAEGLRLKSAGEYVVDRAVVTFEGVCSDCLRR